MNSRRIANYLNIKLLFYPACLLASLFIKTNVIAQTGLIDSFRRAEEFLDRIRPDIFQNKAVPETDVYPVIIINKSGYTQAVLPLPNAENHLIIKTYDGSGQAVHPSVIDFQNEFFIPSWNGYRYWMAYTPYPYTNAKKENPSIAVSLDGINWEEHPKITNPVIKIANDSSGENYADPDIIYDEKNDQLYLYYFHRKNNKDTAATTELIRIGKDLRCSQPVTVLVFPGGDSITFVSPCIWRESETKWHMWGVRQKNPNHIAYLSSQDGIHWSKQKLCFNQDGKNPFHQVGYRAWHISCKPNYRENRIEFMVNCSRGAWETEPSNKTKALFFAEADMDQPSLMSVPINIPIIFASQEIHHWDYPIIYRTSFVIYDSNNQYFYKAWYSGASYRYGTWHIGFTEGNIGNYYTNLRIYTPDTRGDDILIDCSFKTVMINYNGKENDSVEVKLFSKQGLPIFQSWIYQEKTEIDIAMLPPGEYFAAFSFRNFKTWRKVVLH